MGLRAVIIDDEPGAIQNLQSKLQEFCPEVQIVGSARSANDGYDVLLETKPDLLFLDVEMPKGTGFDLLRRISNSNLHVIFVTAFNHYAINAIKFSAADYLLKPINIDELIAAVEKVKQALKQDSKSDYTPLIENVTAKTPIKLAIATTDGYHYINVPEIIHIKANGSYSDIYLTNDRKFMVSRNIKEYEQMLSGSHFLRVHNSHVINLHRVAQYIKKDGSYIVMENATEVPISKAKKDLFVNRMKEL